MEKQFLHEDLAKEEAGEESTLISHIMYDGQRNHYSTEGTRTRVDLWYGRLKSSNASHELESDWFDGGLFWTKDFVEKCKNNKGKWTSMEPGNTTSSSIILQSPIAQTPMQKNVDLKHHSWTPILQGGNPVCMYQQLDDPSCAFNAVSNVLSYFGDAEAAKHIDGLSKTIGFGVNKLDTILQDLWSYHGYQVFKLSSCIEGESLKVLLPEKTAEKNQHVAAILHSLPKVGQIEASDGTIGHSVGIIGDWIFDSNLTHAFPLSKAGLDWSSSTATSKSSFVRFHRLYAFAKHKHTYNLRIPDSIQKKFDCKKYQTKFHEDHEDYE